MKNISLLSDWARALRHLNETDWQSSGWNMGIWALHKLPESPVLDCGTVCCAYGLGTTLPSWKAANIGLEKDCRVWAKYALEGGMTRSNIPRWEIPKKVWEKLGLTESDFNYITDPDWYGWDKYGITPLQVAERIEEILKRDDSYRSYIKMMGPV